MFTDDIKLFAKNEKDWILKLAIRKYNKDTRMENSIEKMCNADNKKWKKTKKNQKKKKKKKKPEAIELLNQERIQMFGTKEIYKYFGI